MKQTRQDKIRIWRKLEAIHRAHNPMTFGLEPNEHTSLLAQAIDQVAEETDEYIYELYTEGFIMPRKEG